MMRWGWAIIGLNLSALVALVFLFPHLMVSPGPVIPAHANIATDCFACHSALRGASSERCMACHRVADIGLKATKGQAISRKGTVLAFHQQLAEQNCVACHSDHAGLQLPERAKNRFSHALLNAATRERCQACHKAPDTALHRRISGSCSQCHSQSAWKPATFEHDKLFLLDRDHNVDCNVCHSNQDYSRYTCYGCHEHSPARVQSQHDEAGNRNLDNCVVCHRTASGEGGERGGNGD
jgi:hypothetical protein